MDRLHLAGAPERAQVLRDPEQRVRPRPRARELEHGRQAGLEQPAGETLSPRMGRSTDDRAERPDRAAVTIVGAGVVFPPSRVRHEVPESPALGLECVIHEREVTRRESAHELRIVGPAVLRERQPADKPLNGRTVMLIGTNGLARAMAHRVQKNGGIAVTVFSRTNEWGRACGNYRVT